MPIQEEMSTDQTPISINFDEFDIESYEMKPMTRGLGFHHENKQNNSQIIKARTAQITAEKRQSLTPKKSLNTSIDRNDQFLQSTPTQMPTGHLMSGLEAIYNNEKVAHTKIKKNKEVEKKVKEKIEAEMSKRVLAYIIDLMVVTFVTFFQFFVFFMIAFGVTSIEELVPFFSSSATYIGLFFCLSYFIYFSMLEPVDTLGKRLLNIYSLDSMKKERLTIRSSFKRSFLSLISLPLLGVPMLYKFQDKLTETSVYCNDDFS